MKTRILVISLLVTATLPMMVARAAPPESAASFAADCNDDGAVLVSGNRKVIGGVGTVTMDCIVTMDPHAKLTFKAATLESLCCALIVGDAQTGTRFTIDSSVIDFGSDFVQIAPGCCAGGGEPDRSETKAVTTVTNSTIRGASVELSASTADDRGTVTVTNSMIENTSPEFPISIVGSVAGFDGSVTVSGSTLTSAEDIRIETGPDGSTVATANTFLAVGAVVITTGPGGSCVSSGNSPGVPCS